MSILDNPTFQTLKGFLESPFNTGKNLEKDLKYAARYKEYLNTNKLTMVGYTKIGENYYLHIKVPSEKTRGHFYDVVIQFFPSSSKDIISPSLGSYYVKFFSNSPGFIYKYAVLYKQQGYLIEDLYKKMDPNFMDTLPEKSNPNLELSYDSSIYYACMFLREHHFAYLNKLGILVQKKKNETEFFAEISSFNEKKADLYKTKLKNNLEEIQDIPNKRREDSNKKKQVKSTTKLSGDKKPSIHIVQKKTGSNNIKAKIKGTHSTFKKQK